MIGDAYFQLRAQIGTAFFSLFRLAAEVGVSEPLQAALNQAQGSLRDPFLFLAIGPSESGKSALFNALFQREFCGAVEPVTVGKIAIFAHGEEPLDTRLAPEVIECQRPHRFLRDFTVVDTPGFDAAREAPVAAEFEPYLSRADAIFFVIDAGANAAESWKLLSRLDREVLRRAVVVVWPNERVSKEEGAIAVKRLRQTLLKNLGQACPIFAPTAQDRRGREKLALWLEREVIFSTPRRAQLTELERLAEEALREVAARPRASQQAWRRGEENLRRLHDDLADREEESERQIAGALWTLAQSFDGLRARGEALLRARLSMFELARERHDWRSGWAREVETQAHESLTVQSVDAVKSLEAHLRQAHAEHRAACQQALGEELPGHPPLFPREEIAETFTELETALDLERALDREIVEASQMLRLPAMAALGAAAVALGVMPVAGLVPSVILLAGGVALFVILLGVLLRQRVIAAFGQHFTANRATFLTSVEPPLRRASQQFYAALLQPLTARLSVHHVARHRHEPLLERIGQLEETFVRTAAALRASADPAPATEDTTPPAE